MAAARAWSAAATALAAALVLVGCGVAAPMAAAATPTTIALPTLAPPSLEATPPDAPAAPSIPDAAALSIQEYPVPPGSRPHDVAPAPDGSVWYTAQGAGALGRLDPATGETHLIPLGSGSAPHGVIVGPDSAAWVTDSGLNAIVRVDPATEAVQVYPLPAGRGYANLVADAVFIHGPLHDVVGFLKLPARIEGKDAGAGVDLCQHVGQHLVFGAEAGGQDHPVEAEFF